VDHATNLEPGDNPGTARLDTVEEERPGTGRPEWILSIGGMVLAFLASQHHTVMMLLLALGLGNAAAGSMTAVPTVRRVMLAVSLVMVSAIGYRMCHPGRPRSTRVVGAVSIVATVAITAWTVARYGL